MNKSSRNIEFATTDQTTSGGKLWDIQKILRLAVNSFRKKKYSLAIDYCRKVANAVNGGGRFAAEAYYIWCLSCLKMNKPDDARKACYDARLKFGNYLDLVYFELLIATLKGELGKIPRFAERFVELYEEAGGKFDPFKEKTSEHIGKVLLLAGLAHEQLQDETRAADYYKRYQSIIPDEDSIIDKIKGKQIDAGSFIPDDIMPAVQEILNG